MAKTNRRAFGQACAIDLTRRQVRMASSGDPNRIASPAGIVHTTSAADIRYSQSRFPPPYRRLSISGTLDTSVMTPLGHMQERLDTNGAHDCTCV